MKIGSNVITVYWTEDEQPERLRDVFSRELFRKGVIQAYDGWTIENSQGQVCGGFYHITGPKLLVNFLSWLTNLTMGKTHKVDVQTDETGQISSVKEL